MVDTVEQHKYKIRSNKKHTKANYRFIWGKQRDGRCRKQFHNQDDNACYR